MFGQLQIELWLLLRVAVAALLAGVVGWERERGDRSAGLRTHMLVGIAAALAVAVSTDYVNTAAVDAGQPPGVIQPDALRAVQAVLTGIGFLGAGVIFVQREKERVRGLTTGASIFTVAALGITVGFGRFALAAGVTALLLLVLWPLRMVEDAGGDD